MNEPYLVALAANNYALAAAERGPAWAQLSEVTQSVWLERARRDMEAVFGVPVALAVDKPATNG